MKLAFVDTETLGLDPRIHPVWSVALILRDENHDDDEYEWQLDIDPEAMAMADPQSLRINHFRELRSKHTKSHEEFAREFAALTHEAQWVGAVPSFDEERLRHLLWGAGECPTWHYQLIDVEILTLGSLFEQGITLSSPYDSEVLSAAAGVFGTERHTAIGDARWARDTYDALSPKEKRDDQS